MDDVADLPRWGFAFPGPLRDELTALALAGTKTTTAGLLVEAELDDEMPVVGAQSVLVDSAERPVAILETVACSSRPFRGSRSWRPPWRRTRRAKTWRADPIERLGPTAGPHPRPHAPRDAIATRRSSACAVRIAPGPGRHFGRVAVAGRMPARSTLR